MRKTINDLVSRRERLRIAGIIAMRLEDVEARRALAKKKREEDKLASALRNLSVLFLEYGEMSSTSTRRILEGEGGILGGCEIMKRTMEEYERAKINADDSSRRATYSNRLMSWSRGYIPPIVDIRRDERRRFIWRTIERLMKLFEGYDVGVRMRQEEVEKEPIVVSVDLRDVRLEESENPEWQGEELGNYTIDWRIPSDDGLGTLRAGRRWNYVIDGGDALENREELCHPHCQRGSMMCEGEGVGILDNLLESGDILSATGVLREMLSSYNPDDAYASMEKLMSRGEECESCGYVFNIEDEGGACSICDRLVCDECVCLCEECQELMCPRCTVRCPDCGMEFCVECSLNCEECGGWVCRHCAEDNINMIAGYIEEDTPVDVVEFLAERMGVDNLPDSVSGSDDDELSYAEKIRKDIRGFGKPLCAECRRDILREADEIKERIEEQTTV